MSLHNSIVRFGTTKACVVAILIASFILMGFAYSSWGFFGHRRINRMAVFTLPPDVITLFKKNIEYLTEHAVDPDKRRYAFKEEAPRHYIDIDHWGKFPFDNVPRDFTQATIAFGKLYYRTAEGDTLDIMSKIDSETQESELVQFFDDHIMDSFSEEIHELDINHFVKRFPGLILETSGELYFENLFDDYGILPYHLIKVQRDLTVAFELNDRENILKISADLGHYIADAHVPLHTTENYNGQLTNQEGIHAFWESRLPELFADDNYDYFVGKAVYLDNPGDFFWNTVLDSHALLDSVLTIEKKLSHTFPSDQQYCYEDRFEYTIRTQCEPFAEAYHIAMEGMVEKRMRDAILAVGSAWFTAWVDAGQPDLRNLSSKMELSESEKKRLEEQERLFKEGNIKGRKHDH